MSNRKYSKYKTSQKKSVLLLASLLLLLIVSVAGTLAFLVTNVGPVTNTFSLAEVPNKVIEDTSSGVKNDVKIQNTGDANAYIRAKVIATWVEVDANGNPTGNIYGSVPVENTDYSMTWTKSGWVQYEDGYFYYTSPVSSKGLTGVLFTGCTPINITDGKTQNQPDDYKLSIEIIAQSIQADGTDSKGNKPIELAWGVDIEDGSVVSATIEN